MCNLHWCYTFCTGVTLFALVLHLNCTAFSQSESSNFFMYIINLNTLSQCIIMAKARRTRGMEREKMDACTHSIAQAVPAFKYERRYSIGNFTLRDLRIFFKDVTRSHIYSPITHSDLNQQQIDLCYNCKVNLTGNRLLCAL